MAYLREMIDSEDDMSLLIGTSLGGFYAYYLAYKYHSEDKILPAVIINPSLQPWKTLKPVLGSFNNLVTGEPFEWKQEYLDQMQLQAAEIEKDKIDPKYVRFYVSSDDELLDHRGIEEQIPAGAQIKYYDHSAHRFTRFSELFPEIRELYRTSRQDYVRFPC